MQHPQEATPIAEAERDRALRCVAQRRVVQAELLERIAQQDVVVTLGRVQAGKDHRLGRPVARQRLGGRRLGQGNGVPDADLADVLETGRDVADLAGLEHLDRTHLRLEHTYLERIGLPPGRHQHQALASRNPPVDQATVGDHALVRIVVRIEDQPTKGTLPISLRRRDALHDGLENLRHAGSELGRAQQRFLAGQADNLLDLTNRLIRIGVREIDFVDDRDDAQIVLEGQVHVGQRLRLDALGRVHHEQGTFACGERARNLVGEIDVSGGVDQIELVFTAVGGPILHSDRLGLDRDALLALEVHCVEHLGRHLALRQGAGQLEQTVSQGRLTVIDMGDDREIANPILVQGGGCSFG